jgi:hypothetical protein
MLIPLAVVACSALAAPPELDRYDPIWTTPSPDASGSMPIGNGTLGANVWVEPSGDLLLLLSRTDAWSETDRLLKLGRLRVRCEPNPFAAGVRLHLRLARGVIEVTAHDGSTISIFVRPTVDQLHAEARLASRAKVSVAFETWRTEKRVLENSEELQSAWTMRDAPADLRRELVFESADVVRVTQGLAPGVLWFHRNEHSIVPFSLSHQGLDSIKTSFRDPLIRRTFGGILQGASNLAPLPQGATLASAGPVRDFSFRVTTHSAQTETAEQWTAELLARSQPEPGPGVPRRETEQWWSQFWDRSWVFVEGDGPGAAAAGPKPVPSNRHPLRLGSDSNGQNVFDGEMGEFGVYSRVLSAQEIAALAAAAPNAKAPQDPARLLDPRSIPEWPVQRTTPPRGLGSFTLPAEEALAQGFTLHAHLKPAANLGPARILDKMTAGGSDGFIFDTHPGDSLRLIVGDLTVHARGVLTRGEWQHAAATYDAATGSAVLFLNGKPVASGGPKWNDTAPPSEVTRAYVLQRWVQACGGGPRAGSTTPADWPIKFNGSIFTVEPVHTQGQPHNPDWRKWGGSYWWQNTRLPYYSMLGSGDFEMMEPLFRFYENALEPSKARTTLYYNAKGVYFPETITTFAGYANGDYGWNRQGLAAGDISPCPWWQWAWNQSLELTQLMLDHASYTGDTNFLTTRAIPMAREALLYFDTRFSRDAAGKLRITPTQAAETYWHGVINDAPVVAGLHTVCDQLLALPASIGSPEDRALWRRMKDAAPALPVWSQNGVRMAAPAEIFENRRNNVETAELYPLWPFREYGHGKSNNDLAVAAYRARVDKSTVGWTQDGLFAARLGLTDEAKTQLLARVRNSHPNHRFKAMWGPNFDWLPDQCHGSNILTQTQLMLIDNLPDGKIALLPAWPREWNVSFRLYAANATRVECEYRDGAIVRLLVVPESRRADIVLPTWLKPN